MFLYNFVNMRLALGKGEVRKLIHQFVYRLKVAQADMNGIFIVPEPVHINMAVTNEMDTMLFGK